MCGGVRDTILARSESTDDQTHEGGTMILTELLRHRAEDAYHAAEGLLALVDEDKLSWKPETGSNWMTTAQLLKHLSDACGAAMKGFVSGDWGPPPGDEENALPTAEKLPAVLSVDEARRALAADKRLALEMIAKAGETDLTQKRVASPWDPTPRLLGYQLSEMIDHLISHKAQLFYYLKLQGKPVNTGHLWGM
jgi:uncharacterized damage-inducible protein DinB